MNSGTVSPLPSTTLYNLLEQLLFLLDNRYAELRSMTRYGKVRLSDIRVFVQVARKARGESEIAQAMNITRQAVQNSVKRLIEMDMVKVVPLPNNGRNKVVQLTDRGVAASATVIDHIRIVDAECAAIIGADELDRLRGLLLHLGTGYKATHAPKKPGPRRQATGV
jgi:DNA-binding MarR family transcriptional regulator